MPLVAVIRTLLLHRQVLSKANILFSYPLHFSNISDPVSEDKKAPAIRNKSIFIESLKRLSKCKEIESKHILKQYLKSEDWLFIENEMTECYKNIGVNFKIQSNVLLTLINHEANPVLYQSLLDYILLKANNSTVVEIISILTVMPNSSAFDKIFISLHHILQSKLIGENLLTFRESLFNLYVHSCLWKQSLQYMDVNSLPEYLRYLMACVHHRDWDEYCLYLKNITQIWDASSRSDSFTIQPILRALSVEQNIEVRTKVLEITLKQMENLKMQISKKSAEAIKNFFLKKLEIGQWTAKTSPTLIRNKEKTVCLSCNQALDDYHVDNKMTDQLRRAFLSTFFENSQSYFYIENSSVIKYMEFLDTNGPFDLTVDLLNFIGHNFQQFQREPEVLAKSFAHFLRIVSKYVSVNRVCLFYKPCFGQATFNTFMDCLKDNADTCRIFHFRPLGYTLKNNLKFHEIIDDDIFLLFAAFSSGPSCYVVSNDNFTKYQNALAPNVNDVFHLWRRVRLIQSRPIILLPPTFADAIQGSMKTGWHIPYAIKELLHTNKIEPHKNLICIKKS